MKLTIGATAMCVLGIFATTPRLARCQSETRTHIRVVPAEEQALHDLLVKAKSEVDGNNFVAAQADYEKYLAQRPNDASAHFDLGYVFTAQRKRDKAIIEYRKAIELDPKMIDAQLNLGISLLTDDPKAAIEPLQKVVELNYANERGHYLLGVAMARDNKAAGAEKQFVIATKLNPNDAEAHAALGRTFLDEGKSADAETEFRDFLKLKPGDQEGEMGLTQSLLGQKKTAAAVAVLTDYLRENPNDAKARVTQASLLAEVGKNDDALAALDLAAKNGPETVDALKLRYVIYDSKSDYLHAAAALQKAAAIAPEDASIHARLGHTLIGTKDYSGAVHELKEALRLDPSATDTLRDLVTADYLQKDFAGTLVALDALDRREPPDAGIWFIRGSCYDHMNQAQPALDAYRKFLAMNTNKNSNQYFEAAQRVRFLQAVLKRKGR